MCLHRLHRLMCLYLLLLLHRHLHLNRSWRTLVCCSPLCFLLVAILTPELLAHMLADGRTLAFFALTSPPTMLADAPATAVLALVPLSVMLANAVATTLFAAMPLPLMDADGTSAAIFALASTPIMNAPPFFAAPYTYHTFDLLGLADLAQFPALPRRFFRGRCWRYRLEASLRVWHNAEIRPGPLIVWEPGERVALHMKWRSALRQRQCLRPTGNIAFSSADAQHHAQRIVVLVRP